MKRLIITDIKSYSNNGKSTGHYYSVAQNYLDLYSDFCDVKIAGGQIYLSKFNNDNLIELPFNTSSQNSRLKNKYYVLKNAHILFKQTSLNDIIVMQQCGALTMFLAIALFANKRRNNIYIIEYDTEAISSKIKRFIFSLAKNRINGIICPNDFVGKSYGLPYVNVTDYIYNNKDKDIIVEKKYDFCIVGSIWPDKGVLEVAEYLKNKNCTLLIAGKPCNENIKEDLLAITKECSNIKLHLDYISECDYNKYIRESRYCILNYQGCYNNRSSGVILDILFNKVPVIAKECNATQFIKKYNAGYIYNSIDEINIKNILNDLVYEKYILGVQSFLDNQKKYKEKIISFLHLL